MSPRVPLELLVAAYRELGSVHAVGLRFGVRGSSVHERLVKRVPGLVKSARTWTPERSRKLAAEYERHAQSGTLDSLARRLGTDKTTLCWKARQLGLTNQRRSKPYHAVWLYMSEPEAAKLWQEFKASSLGLVAWCKRNRHDDLGFARTMKQFFGDEYESVIESKQPRQGLYRRGRQFEYAVRDLLRGAGFFAQRSPASKSPVDILAVRTGAVWMVQCKRAGQLGVADWNELFETATRAGAVPVLATCECGRGSTKFFELTDRKDGSKRRQPMRSIQP